MKRKSKKDDTKFSTPNTTAKRNALGVEESENEDEVAPQDQTMQETQVVNPVNEVVDRSAEKKTVKAPRRIAEYQLATSSKHGSGMKLKQYLE